MASILVVEDQPGVRDLMCRVLRTAGHTVTAAATGAEGLHAAINTGYDLVLLDLVLPDLPGEDVLRAMVAMRPGTRVVVVSSDSSITRRIGVLDAGAADFVPKPFANAELLARVRLRLGEAALRGRPVAVGALGAPSAGTGGRGDAGEDPDVVEVGGGFHLDVRNRQLVGEDARVPLSPRECALLAHLVRRRGDVCSRPELLSDVWGMDFDPGTNVLDVYINRLRGKLSRDRIETVKNVGYRLAAG